MDDPPVYKIMAKFLGLTVKPLCDLVPSPVAPCYSPSATHWATQSFSTHHIPSCSSPHTVHCFCLKCLSLFYLPGSTPLILQGQTPMSWLALPHPTPTCTQTEIHTPSLLCVPMVSGTALFEALKSFVITCVHACLLHRSSDSQLWL